MTKDWLSIQNEACQLHENRYTLDEIKAALYERHKFQASTRAWRLKFKEWGIKHRTANTSRIRKSTSSGKKVKDSEKSPTTHGKASNGLESPVLRYFKDGQVNEDTKFLEDLDHEGRLHLLAQEFVAHDYDDDTTSSYYHLFAEWHVCRKFCEVDDFCIGKVREKAFWDIMRNRAKVLPALYKFLRQAYFLFRENDFHYFLFGPCVERNEHCVHSTECLSVASASLLHAKDRHVPGYWGSVGFDSEEGLKLILRAWVSGDLRAPEKFLEEWCEYTDVDPNAFVTILEDIPNDHPEIKVKAVEIVAAHLVDSRLSIVCSMRCLRVLHTAESPLNWRLAEIILCYSGAKPVDCLNRLTEVFNDILGAKEPVDLTEPSLSVVNTLLKGLESYMGGHWSLKDSSDAEKHQIVSYFMHVITKSWLDLVLQDDTGSLKLNAVDILKIREDFGGLPKLRLSVDAAALSQTANKAFLKSLEPRLLGWESTSNTDPPRNGTNDGTEQTEELQSDSQDEDEDEHLSETPAP
ncbi:hypothetical protein AC578_1572 [Pseudocercospora eumusae]|uniref:Clr5 domain-containing protein n=1 Tax=Pseudocercospora eumusae TaxID=321146 RepID=A0A139HLM2_9PEZI|nr:hypothetical protein AC578_1572 [Pseudocercospora eumusae]